MKLKCRSWDEHWWIRLGWAQLGYGEEDPELSSLICRQAFQRTFWKLFTPHVSYMAVLLQGWRGHLMMENTLLCGGAGPCWLQNIRGGTPQRETNTYLWGGGVGRQKRETGGDRKKREGEGERLYWAVSAKWKLKWKIKTAEAVERILLKKLSHFLLNWNSHGNPDLKWESPQLLRGDSISFHQGCYFMTNATTACLWRRVRPAPCGPRSHRQPTRGAVGTVPWGEPLPPTSPGGPSRTPPQSPDRGPSTRHPATGAQAVMDSFPELQLRVSPWHQQQLFFVFLLNSAPCRNDSFCLQKPQLKWRLGL